VIALGAGYVVGLWSFVQVAVMIELAEKMVDIVDHADWAMFAKNGTDATTICVTIARAGTGRRKLLVCHGAYHGASHWCTPGMDGIVEEDRAHQIEYEFNDIASLEAAVEKAGDDLAAILITPFMHDVFCDQEMVDPAFAQRMRELCDEKDAALIIDDVRAGFRMAYGCSWETIGVQPDLCAWSKCLANGYPLAAVTGNERFREAGTKVYTTGSFWFAATPMAAAIACLDEVKAMNLVGHIEHIGEMLRAGLDEQASAHGFALRQTGPAQMPMILFEDDGDFQKGFFWCSQAIKRGVYLHPWHNMFINGAHTEDDIKRTLEVTDEAFAALKKERGAD